MAARRIRESGLRSSSEEPRALGVFLSGLWLVLSVLWFACLSGCSGGGSAAPLAPLAAGSTTSAAATATVTTGATSAAVCTHGVAALASATASVPPAVPVVAPVQSGATFHVDPALGTALGDGSVASPWRTLEEVIGSGQITQVKPGDRVLLYDGQHGEVSLSGDNAEFVTISAAPGQTPTLGRLEVRQGSKWRLVGLTVSPEFAAAPYTGPIVSLGERGPSSALELEDCFVYTTQDVHLWGVSDWLSANNGIQLGRHGTNLVARNNHVLNTRFGISVNAADSLCEGNIVAGFSGDGVRVTRDGIVLQYNVIKNGYLSEAAGDANHDDGIQCFLFNVGTGQVTGITIKANVIIAREDDRQLFPTNLQGIGFFDGPLVNFRVEQNVVLVNHWHGVSLYDAQGCEVLDNVTYSRWGGVNLPWVKLGEKQGLARGNKVQGNYAHSFDLRADASVDAKDNLMVTPQIFTTRLNALDAQIQARFGAFHPVSGHGRVGTQRRP